MNGPRIRRKHFPQYCLDVAQIVWLLTSMLLCQAGVEWVISFCCFRTRRYFVSNKPRNMLLPTFTTGDPVKVKLEPIDCM